MATYTASNAVSITTVGSQVDTITLTGSGKILRIVNRSGTTHTFFTTAPLGQTPTTPTVGGDNCLATDPTLSTLDFPWNGAGAVIKLINSGIVTLTFMIL
jgi:hypothetical protein